MRVCVLLLHYFFFSVEKFKKKIQKPWQKLFAGFLDLRDWNWVFGIGGLEISRESLFSFVLFLRENFFFFIELKVFYSFSSFFFSSSSFALFFPWISVSSFLLLLLPYALKGPFSTAIEMN